MTMVSPVVGWDWLRVSDSAMKVLAPVYSRFQGTNVRFNGLPYACFKRKVGQKVFVEIKSI